MGMTTVQESRILEALNKAKSVGVVEETVTVCGCDVTMRNLLPDEYEDIVEESKDKADASFLYTYQMGHICRAICEVGDIDLRGVDYVETTVKDPKNPGNTKTVKLERHEWLRTKVLSTWGREALSVLYRKFVDVLSLAEEKSSEGVSFIVPDESEEDKYRRLLGEMKEIEEELPDDLIDHILESQGYRRKSADQKAGAERLDNMAKAAPEPEAVPEPEPKAIPEPRIRPRPEPSPQDPAPAPEAVKPPGADPMEMIRRKTPAPKTRAAQIAELEAATANLKAQLDEPPDLPPKPQDADEVILEKPQPQIDPQAAASILDQPPVVGINPRYKPHGR